MGLNPNMYDVTLQSFFFEGFPNSICSLTFLSEMSGSMILFKSSNMSIMSMMLSIMIGIYECPFVHDEVYKIIGFFSFRSIFKSF